MAGEVTIPVIGNLVADPEFKVVGQQNTPLVKFTVAHTSRVFDKNTGQWTDSAPNFFEVEAWRDLANHVAGSFQKGSRVIVIGHISTESWDEKDQNGQLTGRKRSKQIIIAEEVGASVRFGTAQFQRSAPQQQNVQSTPQNAWQGAQQGVNQPQQHVQPQQPAQPQQAQPQQAQQAPQVQAPQQPQPPQPQAPQQPAQPQQPQQAQPQQVAGQDLAF